MSRPPHTPGPSTLCYHLALLLTPASVFTFPHCSHIVAGYNNILEWSLDKDRVEASDGDTGGGGNPSSGAIDVFRHRDSTGFAAPKTRPLYARLELLLDLIFRRLFWDPTQADMPFNYDSLLKLIKKIDKDLGAQGRVAMAMAQGHTCIAKKYVGRGRRNRHVVPVKGPC